MARSGRSSGGDRVVGLVETSPVRLRAMEAVFISLMVLVVLLSGYVALLVLYKLFKTDS